MYVSGRDEGRRGSKIQKGMREVLIERGSDDICRGERQREREGGSGRVMLQAPRGIGNKRKGAMVKGTKGRQCREAKGEAMVVSLIYFTL